MMKNFFYLHSKEYKDTVCARAVNPHVKYIEQLKPDEVIPFHFEMSGKARDFQPEINCFPLMSVNLKHVLETANNATDFVWHQVTLVVNGQSLDYYVPHFFQIPDVIDRQATIFVGDSNDGSIIRACLSLDKVGDMEFFPMDKYYIRLVISERLRDELKRQKLTGVEFSGVPRV
ncbi:MAG TPA: DUF1629 domain-containing protein [Methylophilaceae bacterium]|jgi:hypothetical protein